MRFVRKLVFAVALAGLSCFAQEQEQKRSSTVVVLDATDALIPSAQLTLEYSGKTVTVTGDAAGRIKLPSLPAGVYSVTVSAQGFSSETITLQHRTGREQVRVHLRVAVDTQNIDVTADDSLSSDGASNHLVLEGDDLRSLSASESVMRQQLELLAGPQVSNGGLQIYVNGFSGGRLPPKSSIARIDFNRDPFSAAFDAPGTGRVEITTKVGSPIFHGGAYFAASHSSLNSRNPYSDIKPDYLYRVGGIFVQGPLASRRASFAASTDWFPIEDNAVINASVVQPDGVTDRLATSVQKRTTLYDAIGTINIQLTQNHLLQLHHYFSRDSYGNEGVGKLVLAEAGRSRTENYNEPAISLTDIFGAHLVTKTRLKWTYDLNEASPNDDSPQVVVSGAFTSGGSGQGGEHTVAKDLALYQDAMWQHGPHSVQAGMQWRRSSIDAASYSNFNGSYLFSGSKGPQSLDATMLPSGPIVELTSSEQYRRTLLLESAGGSPGRIRELGGGASQLSFAIGNPRATVAVNDFFFFLQDEWRPHPHLLLTGGIRYESQSGIVSPADLAPRASFAWQMRKKTIVRGGTGLFYERVGTSLFLNVKRYDGFHAQRYILTNPDTWPDLPSPASLPGSVDRPQRQVFDSSVRTPRLWYSSLAVEQQINPKFQGSLTLLLSHGGRQLHSLNTGTTVAPLYAYLSDGRLKQIRLNAGLTSQFGKGSLQVNYGYGHSRSNTDGPDTFPAIQQRFDLEYGVSALDVRHSLSLLGSASVFGFQLSPMLFWNTGSPFNITTGLDQSGSTVYMERPALSSQSCSVLGTICTNYGAFDVGSASLLHPIPRNFGRAPGRLLVNSGLSRTVTWPRQKQPTIAGKESMRTYAMTLSLDAMNLLNTNNPAPPVGILSSPIFGQFVSIATSAKDSSGAANNRTLNLLIQFSF